MPLQILHQDITKIHCDAIVNPTDAFYSGSGGTDLAVHTAAGSELDEECARLPALQRGEAVSTGAYELPCQWVIHTFGPVWEGGGKNEAMLLRSCYLNALLKAKSLGVASVAFPLISSGTFGFPKDKVLRIATDAISEFLFAADAEMDIYLCVLNRDAYELSRSLDLKDFLEKNRKPDLFHREKEGSFHASAFSVGAVPQAAEYEDGLAEALPCCASYDMREERREYAVAAPAKKKGKAKFKKKVKVEEAKSKVPMDLAGWIRLQDDSFADLLQELIEEKGMEEVACYKKANVSKNTFWKIRNDPAYRPSKPTVLSFAIALKLSIEETDELLKSAGFAFSGNNLFDMIIEFYITNGEYNIHEINAALYQYDQPCLGC